MDRLVQFLYKKLIEKKNTRWSLDPFCDAAAFKAGLPGLAFSRPKSTNLAIFISLGLDIS